MDPSAATQAKKSAIRWSVLIGVGLLVMKFGAWRLTGSAAVLSDAMESIINVAAAAFALFAIYVAAMPADESHPYGHGKIEYFSAGFEGALIMAAAVAIIWAAVPRLVEPRELTSLGQGMIFVVGAGVVNLLLGLYLLRQGKAVASPALVADAHHILTDVWTTAGVFVGLVLTSWTGWLILDPIVAILLAVNILVSGWRIIRSSAARLMDEADDDLLARIVARLDALRQPGFLQPHQLRATTYGSRLHIDFHLFMPRFWELDIVHTAVDELESDLQADLETECDTIIHVDPCRPRHCPACDLSPCPVRSVDFQQRDPWTVETIKSAGRHPDIE